jgi:hypothetical protein
VVNDRQRGYYEGFAEALMYAQAHNDVEGGSQTLETHLPQPEYTEQFGFKFSVVDLITTISELDDEGRVTMWRLGKDEYDSHTIELGGSEGYHGLPDWT